MSTTATLSGLNGFDFSTLISATIQDASAPLNALKTQQRRIADRFEQTFTRAARVGA